jgi:peroxiredoxin Q/BCP
MVAAMTTRGDSLKPLPRMTMINEGDRAPGFLLAADDGTTVTLESLAGKNAILFFYPKDNTSG